MVWKNFFKGNPSYNLEQTLEEATQYLCVNTWAAKNATHLLHDEWLIQFNSSDIFFYKYWNSC